MAKDKKNGRKCKHNRDLTYHEQTGNYFAYCMICHKVGPLKPSKAVLK
jgi:hypothetical protein